MQRLDTLHMGRNVCLLREDVRAFERVLLATFPDLRFLWKDVGHHTDLYGPDGRPANGGWPVFGPVPYLESLQQDSLGWTMAWREEPDWLPVWRRLEWSSSYTILNRPERRFYYSGGHINRGGNRIRPDLAIFRAGILYGRYAREDKEQRAFLRKVMRLLGKVATNKLAGFVPGSRTDLREIKSCDVWAGFHAIEWCRKDPRRRLGGCRPREEVETGLPRLPPEAIL